MTTADGDEEMDERVTSISLPLVPKDRPQAGSGRFNLRHQFQNVLNRSGGDVIHHDEMRLLEDGERSNNHMTSVVKNKKTFTRIAWLCSIGCNFCLAILVGFFFLMTVQLQNQIHGNDHPEDNHTGHHAHDNDRTEYYCPFTTSYTPDVNYGNVYVAQIGTNFVVLCWKDIAPDIRGEITSPYSIFMKDFFSFGKDNEFQLVYNGRALEMNVTSLLPSTKYSFKLQTKNENSLFENSFEIDAVTLQTEHCGNKDDVLAIKSKHSTLKWQIQQCLISNMLNEHAAVECVHDKVGLSESCSNCWIDEGHCTLANCATKCLFPNSDRCKECSELECFGALITCSGLPRWAFPP